MPVDVTAMKKRPSNLIVSAALALVASHGVTAAAMASPEDDRRAVAALDTEFQAAVKHHDVGTMERILHDEMILVLGDGRVVTKEDQLQSARERAIRYEIQDEDPGTQAVRVWGDTAVVTARLWFSDTYARTPQGWKYVFGQASLKLPDPPAD